MLVAVDAHLYWVFIQVAAGVIIDRLNRRNKRQKRNSQSAYTNETRASAKRFHLVYLTCRKKERVSDK